MKIVLDPVTLLPLPSVPAPADDAGRGFDRWCDHCRRVTRWRMVAMLAGQQVGKCGECEMEMIYEQIGWNKP